MYLNIKLHILDMYSQQIGDPLLYENMNNLVTYNVNNMHFIIIKCTLLHDIKLCVEYYIV